MPEDLPLIPIVVIRYRRRGETLLPETVGRWESVGYNDHDDKLKLLKRVYQNDPAIRIVGPNDAVHKAHDPGKIVESQPWTVSGPQRCPTCGKSLSDDQAEFDYGGCPDCYRV